MDFKTIAGAVSKYAPLLGESISETNPIAGLMVMAIAKLFNTSSDPSSILAGIQSDPEAATKLQQLELEHQEAILKYQLDDRSSAREREEKIVSITGKNDYVLDSIAFLVIAGYFCMCTIVAFTKLDQSDHDVLYMMVGQLTGGFIMVLSYYFGSSNK